MPIEVESPEERGYGSLRHNLTESSVSDATLEQYGVDLSGQVLAYGDHRGLPELRELIVDGATGCTADDVLCTPGAAAALFFVATSVLSAGDHALVQHTNYATNLETPRLLGVDVQRIELRLEDGFALDLERLAADVRPSTALDLGHHAAQPHRHHAAHRRAARAGRPRRAPLLLAAGRRDLP